jgi:sugar phosphate isomerase/epimerase
VSAIQIAFTTYSTPAWSPERIAEEAARLGFDAVELRMYDGHEVPPGLAPGEVARLRAAFAGRGVPLCALGTSCRFSGDDAERARQVADARRYIALAAELGAPLLRVFGGPYDRAAVREEEACARVAAALADLAEPARAAGVTLALETHDAFAAARTVGSVLRQVDHPAVGACWDWLHPFRVGETAAESFGFLRGRVVHTHTKDARRVNGGWDATPFGEGQLPLDEIVASLVATGYAGPLSLEWEPRAPDAQPERALAQYVPAVRALLARHGVAAGGGGGA